jgi:LAS superfamily LD-carboxypeptidase LdcB
MTKGLLKGLTERQLTGREESHLIALDSGHQLQRPVAAAFEALQGEAKAAGFDLQIASSFRSFERQRAIWNGKASGARPVHDDSGGLLVLADLSSTEQLHAIMRFSALPGTSRHHWGSDLDVFDAGVLPPDYRLQLSPEEVAEGGIFDPLHSWLDEKMAGDQSHGFFRPYAVDRGGVAIERWHLSYAPVSCQCAAIANRVLLESVLGRGEIDLWQQVHEEFDQLLQRYISVPTNWCPSRYLPR